MKISPTFYRSIIAGIFAWFIGTTALWLVMQVTGRYGLSLWVATAATTPFTFIIKYLLNKKFVFRTARNAMS